MTERKRRKIKKYEDKGEEEEEWLARYMEEK